MSLLFDLSNSSAAVDTFVTNSLIACWSATLGYFHCTCSTVSPCAAKFLAFLFAIPSAIPLSVSIWYISIRLAFASVGHCGAVGAEVASNGINPPFDLIKSSDTKSLDSFSFPW